VRITLSDLTVDVGHLDQERLLDDWRWLIGPSKRLILVSAIGDAFLQDELEALSTYSTQPQARAAWWPTTLTSFARFSRIRHG
jgi:hypothetical protein